MTTNLTMTLDRQTAMALSTGLAQVVAAAVISGNPLESIIRAAATTLGAAVASFTMSRLSAEDHDYLVETIKSAYLEAVEATKAEPDMIETHANPAVVERLANRVRVRDSEVPSADVTTAEFVTDATGRTSIQ